MPGARVVAGTPRVTGFVLLRLALVLKRNLPRLAGLAMIPLIRGLFWLARLLGAERASRVGGWVTRTIGPFLPAHRIATANLRAAFPERDEAAIRALALEAWDNLGRTGAEYAHLHTLFDLDPADLSASGRITVAGGRDPFRRPARRRETGPDLLRPPGELGIAGDLRGPVRPRRHRDLPPAQRRGLRAPRPGGQAPDRAAWRRPGRARSSPCRAWWSAAAISASSSTSISPGASWWSSSASRCWSIRSWASSPATTNARPRRPGGPPRRHALPPRAHPAPRPAAGRLRRHRRAGGDAGDDRVIEGWIRENPASGSGCTGAGVPRCCPSPSPPARPRLRARRPGRRAGGSSDRDDGE